MGPQGPELFYDKAAQIGSQLKNGDCLAVEGVEINNCIDRSRLLEEFDEVLNSNLPTGFDKDILASILGRATNIESQNIEIWNDIRRDKYRIILMILVVITVVFLLIFSQPSFLLSELI